LCDKAPSDGILASAMVRMMAAPREQYSFESVGMLQLKGIPAPVEAFAASWEALAPEDDLGAASLPSALRAAPAIPYTGRLEERERLRGCIEAARTGNGRVVLLSGEPGIGKTRLAAHATLEAHGAGFTVCWATAEEDLGAPYGPWIQALSHYVQHAPKEVLARHVDRHGGELTRLVRDALTKRAVEATPPPQTDAETERYRLFRAVADLLASACEHGPVIFVLDDLQWADKETLALLKHVALTTSDRALILLGIYRESDLGRGHPLTALLADLRRAEGVERVALRGLSTIEVGEIMAATAGQPTNAVSRTLAQEVAAETGGNPFFVAEIQRHLVESGAITQDAAGLWRTDSSLAALGLPESVRDVVCRRVERLGEPSGEILTFAAVIGRSFDLELLELLMEGYKEELVDSLEGAVRAFVLVESNERAGRFSFAHGLINQALYAVIGRTRRGRLHRQVAAGLERLTADGPGETLVAGISEAAGSAGGSATILAHHWREAGDLDRAVHYLVAAAERAGQRDSQPETVSLYHQALELIPDDDQARRRDVKMKRAIAYARFTHAVGGDA
jgi:predicted ATPase